MMNDKNRTRREEIEIGVQVTELRKVMKIKSWMFKSKKSKKTERLKAK